MAFLVSKVTPWYTAIYCASASRSYQQSSVLYVPASPTIASPIERRVVCEDAPSKGEITEITLGLAVHQGSAQSAFR